MCKETISVSGIQNDRISYEVESFLRQNPWIIDARVDPTENVIEVEYDETQTTHDRVLDCIEHAGLIPHDRKGGLLDSIRSAL